MTDRRTPRWEFGRHLRSRRGWRRAEADVREEMRLHVDWRQQELEAQGVPADEARRRASREAGDPARVAAAAARFADAADRRDSLRQWGDEIAQDVRHALRSARRSPGFAAVTVLTIALGLGANAAIFGVVNVAVVAPLPFDPDNTLVRVREYRVGDDGAPVLVDASRRTADAVAIRPDLFTRSVAMTGAGRALARDTGALRVAGTRVGPGFTAVVGIAPIVGRTFTPEEERAGEGSGVALISHRLWRTEFGGAPDVAGQSMRLDGRPFTIVGVLPSRFHVPYDSDIWFPSHFAETERSIFIFARLAPGVSLDSVRRALDVIGRRLREEYPNEVRGLSVTAMRARDYFVDNEHQTALALMGAVALLLLIGCSNVALLLTTKFASRQAEVAVRASLGCSRARQIRQFVTEGLVLFIAGGAAGLLVVAWLSGLLVVFLPELIATQVGFDGIPVDRTLILFAAGLSIATGTVFGLIAARRTTRADLNGVLKGAGRSAAGPAGRGTLGTLAIAEIALALVLLSSAGIMVDTFRRLHDRDLGFDPAGVTTIQVDLGSARYASAESRVRLTGELLERIRQMTGVASAGATTVNPLCCGDWGIRVTPDSRKPAPAELTPIVQHFIVTPGYLETIGQRLVDGRLFTDQDRAGAELVVIVDRATADRFWSGEGAVGRRVKRGFAESTEPWLTVVGVVETAQEDGEYSESWYLPHAQHATGPSANGLHLMIRTEREVPGLVAAIRAAGAEVDPALPMYGPATLEGLLADNLRQDRLGALVSAAFAMAGVFLAALGLYGVLSFAVNADRREIGMRLALGATRAHVARMMALRGGRLTGIGLVLGIAGSWFAGRGIATVVEGAVPDARIVAAAAAVLLLTAVLAMAVPTARAVRIDPLRALRSE
jgi:predicted permease